MNTVHLIYVLPQKKYKWVEFLEKIRRKIGITAPLARRGRDFFIKWPDPVRAPLSITYFLNKELKKKYRVRLYDWREKEPCDVKPNDIILVHPLIDKKKWRETKIWSLDKDSVGWKTITRYPGNRTITIVPYTHALNKDMWLRDIFADYSKQLIVICGKTWVDTWKDSPYSNLIQQPFHVNMPIDAAKYPIVKTKFNAKGKRRFLYIGSGADWKNTRQLAEIAANYPEFEGGYISSAEIKGWNKIADFADLTPEFMTNLADKYDFFLNTSISDAQATTIVEHMSFGFGVACTPESGYDHSTIIKLDVSNTEFNCLQIDRIQNMEESEIWHMVNENRKLVEMQYDWNSFTSKIIEYIESAGN